MMGTLSVAEVDELFVDALQSQQVAALDVTPSDTPSDTPSKYGQDLSSSAVGSPKSLQRTSPQDVLSSEIVTESNASAEQSVSAKEEGSDVEIGTSTVAEISINKDIDTDPEEDSTLSNSSEVAQGEAVVETQEVKEENFPEEEDSPKKNDTEEDKVPIKENVTQLSEILEKEEIEEISLEQDSNPESSVVRGAPEPEPLSSTDDAKSGESSEDEEKPGVFSNKLVSPIARRFAGGSEIEEAQASEQAITPPTPERSSTVIRLTRQMSRVSSGMGPMSSRFEIRASRELHELHEKVRLLEEELKEKTSECDTLNSSFKERENHLMRKIECLELANEQLLEGGADSSIQLQMELTRLQRQNSVLSLRERELQFQISTQEMLNAQMLDKRPKKPETTNGSKQLESTIAMLESKLAEAVEVSNMYKLQLHEAFSKQKSVQSAALLNLGDGEDVLKELQKLRKQTKEQEAELQDLQDRFFLVSVRLAESVAHREELLMKIKRIQRH